MTTQNEKRIEREKQIIRRYCVKMISAGYKLEGFSGDYEEKLFDATDNIRIVMAEIHACDDARVICHPTDERCAENKSWMYFVFGNDPEEVLCDHGVKISDLINAVRV